VERKWLNQSQPQTLQAAVMLIYLLGALSVLKIVIGAAGAGLFLLVSVAIIAGQLAGAFFTANDRKWGYYTAVAFAIAPLALIVGLSVYYRRFVGVDVLYLITQIALVALLLHPQSREYRRIWFR